MTPRSMTLLGLLLLLGGCDAIFEPHTRDGAWRPAGANEANLRAMVARPSDLVQGVGDAGAEGPTAAQAVDRLRNDRVRQLPDSSIARLQVTGTGGGAQ